MNAIVTDWQRELLAYVKALTVIDGGKATAKTSCKPKKDARLFLRGSTWYAWVYEDGERVQFSTGSTSRAAAVRALAQREKDGLPVKSSAGKARKRL